MKKFIGILMVTFYNIVGVAQNITTINYQNIPVWGSTPTQCLFNVPGGTPAFQIAGLNHYAVAGGVDYSGNELKLLTYASGLGTAYGIYYPFKQNNIYKVDVEACELTNFGGNNSNINVAINSGLTHSSTLCSPEVVSYITVGAALTFSTPALVYNNYQVYTVVNNFTPTATGLNYLLISGNQYSANGGNHFAGIRKITITETPPQCNLLAPNGLSTSIGSTMLNWNAVAGSNSYNIIVANTHSGLTTTNTYSSSTNNLQYCPTPGDNVSFRVQAVCNNTGLGAISLPFTYTYTPPSSGIPTNLTATLFSPGSYYGYYLNFTPVSGISTYLMDWYNVTNNSVVTTNYPITYTGTNSFFYYQFSAGYSYKYRVATYSPCANGIYSDWSLPILPPGATCATGPTSSSLTQYKGCGGSSSCTYTNLSWPSISGAMQYGVEYSVFNTASGQSLPTGSVSPSGSNTTAYYGTLSGSGWYIHYRVKVNCGSGFGSFSNWSTSFVLQ